MLAVVFVILAEVHAQEQGPSASIAVAPTTSSIISAAAATSTDISSTLIASVTPSSTTVSPPVLPPQPTRTPGPAVNPFEAGTINCLSMLGCPSSEECYVLNDGVVCLDKVLNWGYILSRNDSGVPSVPSWSGPRSQLNDSCKIFTGPESADKPGLALTVYDLIQNTIPKDLLISRFDQDNPNWYMRFSNCEPHLACILGKCQPRPAIGQSCTASWQCNPQALGLNENNSPIPRVNETEIRCEYDGGDKSQSTTCQLLRREAVSSNTSGFSAWHAIVPVVVVLVLIYFGSVIYQRRMRKRKLRKWSRVAEDDRNDFQMERYDEIR
ncbi:hypothetical protein BGX28_009851 [Mortierella sp. GBA30]|nr:hypothetical protein BGX28_009851 [Mortierella sp. GBA30]